MKGRLRAAGILCGLLLWASPAAAGDLTAAFMNCTYQIQGGDIYGTAFVVGQPVAGQPERSHLVLVTAAHILESIAGEKALLHARIREGRRWRITPWPIAIRHQGRALWTRHPAVDLAALRVALPEGASVLVPTVDLVATENDYRRFDIQPGEAVMALGFPMAMGSAKGGFPVLRGGRIASYPLTPIREAETFLVDMPVFPGNSGGPVIMTDTGRGLPDGGRGGLIQVLLGVVSREVLSMEKTAGAAEAGHGRPLSLARVVHAAFIHDLIARLPPP